MPEKPPTNKTESGQLWLITEPALNDIIRAQETPNIEALLAQRGERPQNTSNIEIRGDVAVMNIIGPIARYDNFMSWLFGATSISSLSTDFKKVIDDPAIKAVVLNIDSPGGGIAGVNEFANMVYHARGVKPITAYVGAVGASAAYWMASAADQIIIDESAEAGSIGVVLTTWKQDSDWIVEIVNTASPKKRVDPGTTDGRAELLKRVDAIADVFIAAVARNRGVTPETVVEKYGQGGMFVGKDAVAAGLADELGSLEGVISSLQETINLTKGRLTMDKLSQETLATNFSIIQAQAPELIQAVADKAVEAAKSTATDDGYKAGVAAERERVTGIMATEDADPEAKTKAITDGLSVDASYKLFFEAEKKKKADDLAALDNLPKSAGAQGQESGTEAGGGKADFMAAVDAYQAEKKCSRTVALQAMAEKKPELHKAWLDAQKK